MASACGNENCDLTIEYCDTYETTCKSCADICLLDTSKYDLCSKRCPTFLSFTVVKKLQDLDSIFGYLKVLVALAGLTLVLLCIHLVLRTLRRPKPVNPVDCEKQQPNGALTVNDRQISMQTMSTRLEQESRSPTGMLKHRKDRRIASEDRVPPTNGSAYVNPALSVSPSSPVPGQGSRLPPIAGASNGTVPYTISHSQVV